MTVIDAAVHPIMNDAEYIERLPAPWRNVRLTSVLGQLFEAPFPEITDADAARSPAAMAELLFGTRGVDVAVLSPLTRGLLANQRQAAAVARATNEWVREVWLEHDERFVAGIRLPIADSAASVREIERWADDPRFVEVVVPLRAFAHYGDEQYFPVWEAAADHGLPVHIQDDLANAAEYLHTAVGQPVEWSENDATRSMMSAVHALSLTASSIPDRLPELRFLFGDGGIDIVKPLLWRLDADWKATRVEVPWIEELPSLRAPRFCRFITQAQDGTVDGVRHEDALDAITGRVSEGIYGSHTPFWDQVRISEVLPDGPDAARDALLWGNALRDIPRLAAQPALAALAPADAVR
ncbi:amidohydrolase family protein [Pseudonocardia sp. RS010]|uniref:amidohydrolase family protein n=1 Tax=Pseudonocardia sp. RS010 TaxID=3385979 RepID=UPI0039A20309